MREEVKAQKPKLRTLLRYKNAWCFNQRSDILCLKSNADTDTHTEHNARLSAEK